MGCGSSSEKKPAAEDKSTADGELVDNLLAALNSSQGSVLEDVKLLAALEAFVTLVTFPAAKEQVRDALRSKLTAIDGDVKKLKEEGAQNADKLLSLLSRALALSAAQTKGADEDAAKKAAAEADAKAKAEAEAKAKAEAEAKAKADADAKAKADADAYDAKAKADADAKAKADADAKAKADADAKPASPAAASSPERTASLSQIDDDDNDKPLSKEEKERDAAIEKAKKLEEDMMKSLSTPDGLASAWKQVDNNGSGVASISEIQPWVTKSIPSITEKKTVSKAYRETLPDGVVDLKKTDFVTLVKNVFFYNKVFIVWDAIDAADKSEKKKINAKEFSVGIRRFKLKLSKQQKQDEFNKIDKDKSGKITFDEFCDFVHSFYSQITF